MVNLVTITWNADDTTETAVTGTVTFTPSATVYDSGVPVTFEDVPVQAQITGGQLKLLSGEPVQLVATDNSGLTVEGGDGFWFYSVDIEITVGSVTSQDGWRFALPSSPSTVDLYALKNTPFTGGGAVTSVFGRTGAVVGASGDYSVGQVTGAAPLASPSLTGTPTAPTQTTGDNSTRIATDAFVATAVAAETTRAEAAEALLAPKASPTFTGTVTVPATVNATDAAQKQYVDSVAAGLDAKPSVKVAATGNITLSGTQTIDGVAVTAGDRVLATGQSTASQNGPWVVASGAWTRPGDFASGSSQLGAFVFVEGGTANSSSGWVLTGTTPVTVDTSAQAWTQFSGAGEINAGTGLTKAGNTIALATPVSIANGGTGTATGAPQNDVFAGPVSGGAGAPAFRALAAADLPTATTSAQGAVILDGTAGDIQPSPGTAAAGSAGKAADAGHVHGQPADVAPTGLTGATAASRYVGATSSGAPASGTFAVGDFTLDRTGTIWICTAAGTPGTWTFMIPASGATMAGWLAPKVIALTDASSVSVNAAAGNDFRLTFTSAVGSSRTIAAPSNATDGQKITFELIQAASGGPYTVSWASGASGYDFGVTGAPTLSAAAGAIDQVGFRYSSSKGQWLCTGSALGF